MSTKFDDRLVKKAYKQVQYNKTQLEELAACMHPDTGPMYFMENFMFIQHPTRGREQFTPYPFQYGLVDCYHKYRKSINMISRQMGKALSLDTPILTPSGFVQLGKLEIGDTIYGKDGKETKITYITDTMYEHKCYNVEFAHGETIVADADHLWEITHPHKQEDIVVTTTELESLFAKFDKTTQSVHIKHSDLVEFESTDVPVHPYYLGLWLGDGAKHDLRITCTIDDYDEYCEIFESFGLVLSHFTLDSRSDTTGTFYVKGGASGLKAAGVWGDKHIPDKYIFNSTEVRLQLLQGLMDSDGTCEKNGTSRFYQSDERFIDGVRVLLSTLGIKSTKGTKETTHKDAYTLCFSEKELPVFRLSRKLDRQALLKGHPKNKRLYLGNITEAKSVPVRCLQVDNADHMFLCGETLIPTHNTTVAAGYLLWYAMFKPDSQILIASNKHDGALEIMQRVRYAYESLPNHIRAGVLSYNKKSIEFDNDSRILATTTTSNTGRGMSLSLIYLDEFSFVEANIAKEFWTALSPTLSTGGKCIITSTPDTDEDQFAELWFTANKLTDEFGNETEVGPNGFRPYFAEWSAHPERDDDWAAEQLADLGEDRFAREHQCCNGTTIITLKDTESQEVFDISIREFHELCRLQNMAKDSIMYDLNHR